MMAMLATHFTNPIIDIMFLIVNVLTLAVFRCGKRDDKRLDLPAIISYPTCRRVVGRQQDVRYDAGCIYVGIHGRWP